MDKLPVLLLTALLLAGACVRAQDDLSNSEDLSKNITTTTTEEPATTTTTEEPATTTTTEEPATTTTTEEPATTTTEEPATTTTEPATTTPAPVEDKFFMVTDGNLTCIIVKADITAAISYSKDKGNDVVHMKFPKAPGDMGATATGSCSDDSGEQVITVSWGKPNVSSFQMSFNETKTEWTIISFTADLFMDPKNFTNATDAGKMLHLDMDMTMTSVAVNHSYNCVSKLVMSNVSASIGDAHYPQNVDVTVENTQLEAFNEIKNEKDFLDNVHCDADKTSDIVPITVGCALAALVIIVLIAYLIGRRRRSAAYQSV